jgi:hypothetical protein
LADAKEELHKEAADEVDTLGCFGERDGALDTSKGGGRRIGEGGAEATKRKADGGEEEDEADEAHDLIVMLV